MDSERKLDILVRAAEYDVCGYSGSPQPHHRESSPLRYLYRASLPEGGSVCLFKVLLTNVCTNDCAYCVNQVQRDKPRAAFQPEELSRIFMELYQRRLAQGLFLSSAVAGDSSRTMESMIKTVQILRRKHEYKGYVHLKILPGARFDCVEEACRIANRVSVNMEAPTAGHLARLSSRKDIHRDILERMRWVKQLTARNEKLAPSGQTTQFVVGAAGESDHELLSTVNALYSEIGLKRIYFSAFRPVGDSRLEGVPPTPPMREHRLYQADWLVRVYGFSFPEIELALGKTGNLALSSDPKLVIARRQPWLFPVDMDTASYGELIRVPGIGPVSAQRIVAARREHRIESLDELKKMRVVTRHAAPFLWFKGAERVKQLSFMPELDEELNEPEPKLAVALG